MTSVTLLWFANQRAVEYHVTLFRLAHPHEPDFLVMDLDPPEGADFGAVVARRAAGPDRAGRAGTHRGGEDQRREGRARLRPADPGHGSRGRGRRLPGPRRPGGALDPALATTAYVKEDRAGKVFLDSTRAGGATVVATYSPRARPGVPVSFPVSWDDLDRITPADFTLTTAVAQLDGDPWRSALPAPQSLPEVLRGRRTRDPDRAGAGHARGKATGPGTPGRRIPSRT